MRVRLAYCSAGFRFFLRGVFLGRSGLFGGMCITLRSMCWCLFHRWVFCFPMAVLLGGVFSAYGQDGKSDSFFVGEDGVPTLTNRPEYYRADGGYLEVELRYQPIVIVKSYSFTPTGRIETNDDFISLIEYYAGKYSLNVSLVQAVIKAESNFDPYAVSRAGAQGLMQLMPGTAAEMNVVDPFDPGQNIAGGTQYLYRLLKLFGNDLDLALAGYNAGPGTVKKYGGVPPYKETQGYVAKVKRFMGEFTRGEAGISVKRGTARQVPVFRPSRELPFVVHFKNGASQPALRVTEDGDVYLLEYNLRTYSVRKALVARVEELG